MSGEADADGKNGRRRAHPNWNAAGQLLRRLVELGYKPGHLAWRPGCLLVWDRPDVKGVDFAGCIILTEEKERFLGDSNAGEVERWHPYNLTVNIE